MKEKTEISKLNPLVKWFKGISFFELMALIFIIIGALVIVGVFVVASLDPITNSGSKDILDYSEFLGGFVGSLWALAGVLLFYASLVSQKAELDDQRQLIVKQIDEIVKQTEESRKQNEMFKQQQLEETFFQLMRFQNEIVSSIVLETSEMDFATGQTSQKELSGRKTFGEYYDTFKRFFQDASERVGSHDSEEVSIQRNVDLAYNNFFHEYQSELGHYFRNLYNILIFINELGRDSKHFYLSLLVAQLTNYELGLLFFHGLASTHPKYKSILEQYGILENVPSDELTKMSFALYESSAFGEGGFKFDDVEDYGAAAAESEPMIEEGFLMDSTVDYSEKDDSWEVSNSSDDIADSIRDKLAALGKLDEDESSLDTKEDSLELNNDVGDQERATTQIDGSGVLDDNETHFAADWSSNMLSLEDVATGWEDGGDEFESDSSSEYGELESNIEDFNTTAEPNTSRMANLKVAFSELSASTTKSNMPEVDYDQLFESEENGTLNQSEQPENDTISALVEDEISESDLKLDSSNETHEVEDSGQKIEKEDQKPNKRGLSDRGLLSKLKKNSK